MTSLYRLISRLAGWPMVALLSVALVLCAQGFVWRQEALGWQNQVLDMRYWYTPAEAQRFFEDLGSQGRHLYAITQVTLDFIFPLAYGVWFAILMVRLYGPERAGLLFAPLLTVVADLSENVLTASLAWHYAGQASALAWLAAVGTATKSVLFVITLVLLLIGSVRGFTGRTERQTPR
jgi:hypothetical protein